MTIEYKGYEICTERTEDSFVAKVRRLDGNAITFDGGALGKRPANQEFSTGFRYATEALAVDEVKTWIDSGALK